MQVTTTQHVTIDLTVDEAAVLYRILGSTYEGNGPNEVGAVVSDLFDALADTPGVADAASAYSLTGELTFVGSDD